RPLPQGTAGAEDGGKEGSRRIDSAGNIPAVMAVQRCGPEEGAASGNRAGHRGGPACTGRREAKGHDAPSPDGNAGRFSGQSCFAAVLAAIASISMSRSGSARLATISSVAAG